MKAILEFELPQENSELALATHGTGLYSVIHDFDQHLRMKSKGDHDKPMRAQEVRDVLWEFLNSDPFVSALFE